MKREDIGAMAFAPAIVQGIIDGRITETRRVLNWNTQRSKYQAPGNFGPDGFDTVEERTIRRRPWESNAHMTAHLACPYGEVGRRVWIKEAWQPFFTDGCIYLADAGTARLNSPSIDHARSMWPKWKSPRFMPRKFSRLEIEITGRRIDDLHAVTVEQAMASGCRAFTKDHVLMKYWMCDPADGEFKCSWQDLPRDPLEAYRRYWDFLNKKRGYPWESNNKVWVIEFKVVKAPGISQGTQESSGRCSNSARRSPARSTRSRSRAAARSS